MADRAYDTNAVRQQIETQGAVPSIPPGRTRIWKSCLTPFLRIENAFGRLKDWRRIATRYDRHANNFPSTVHLAATISYRLSARILR